MIKTDICIIGAGSGGLSVAAGAAQLGLSVVLIEKGEMGGDCLNTGCVPSKALLSMAKKGATFRQAHNHVRNAIAQIAPHDSQERFEELGCTVIRQPAYFIDKKTVETADGQKIQARYIVIAAGSRAFIPPIKGINERRILTNETIFNLGEKPQHLAIIGGGPIGVELAQAHVKLGCKVSLITKGEILSKDDRDCVEIVREQLLKDGIALYEHAEITKIAHGQTHKIHLKNDIIEASHILVATGRKPNTDGLHLDKAGIKHDSGGIIVDKRLRTNHHHIYAIGDILKDSPQFTHVAGYQAGIVIRNICFKLPAKVDYKALPWVTYTAPELAHIGMTETQAIEAHGQDNIRILSKDISGNDRAVTEGVTQGLIKIIGRMNGKILGVSIVAENAGEMLPLWSLAITKGMKMKDVAGLILPYPTVSDVNKSIAGEWYKGQLFSSKTKKIIRLLQKLPL
jgi:pyruvate/2-oxoglutarate dehydrogenase complex dihydrolipoamide dehydrogenase (E3) component